MLPPERKRAWQAKRVFFLTPQVMSNDLSRGAFPALDVKCLVIDEAHKATGNHAYCQASTRAVFFPKRLYVTKSIILSRKKIYNFCNGASGNPQHYNVTAISPPPPLPPIKKTIVVIFAGRERIGPA